MFLYEPSSSFFHKLHPVSRLLLLVAMIAGPFVASHSATAVSFLVAYLAMLFLASGKRNFLRFWKLLAVFWIFSFLIWIVVPTLRRVPWSYDEAGLLATRVDCFVLAGLVFVSSTRTEEFTYALTRFGIPYKPAFALSLGFRLVPLFYQNLQTIVAAQRCRGVDLQSAGFLARVKAYIPILAVLISYGIRNADLMAVSLEAKGFGYAPDRTFYLQTTFGWRDAAAGLLVLVAGTCLMVAGARFPGAL